MLSSSEIVLYCKQKLNYMDSMLKTIKQELAKPTVLALYSLEAKIKVWANASNSGLEALLQQQQTV